MKTKICPFCAEQIATAAIKCKYCHSMLPEEPKVEVQQLTFKQKLSTVKNLFKEDGGEIHPQILNYILCIPATIVGFLLCYFGSWHLMAGELSIRSLSKFGYSPDFMYNEWGDKMIGFSDALLTGDQPAFLLGRHSLLISINDSYFGFICSDEFFDSSVLQWIMLVLGVYFIISGLYCMFIDTDL